MTMRLVVECFLMPQLKYIHFDDVFSYARKQYSLDKDGLLKTIAELFTWYEKHGSENFDAEQAGETIQELIEEIEQYF